MQVFYAASNCRDALVNARYVGRIGLYRSGKGAEGLSAMGSVNQHGDLFTMCRLVMQG